MEDFQSKYSGEQVEAILDSVANGEAGGGGGGITVETDPVFSASAAAGITAEDIAEWNNKVDKVSGKQLSTEDFTSALKAKLEGLSNYDDTELSEAIATLRQDFDELVSGDTTTAIKTFNEVIAFLDGVQDTQDLAGIIASIEQQIAAKQDKITDLDTIRSGAALGATALQSVPSEYVTETQLSSKGYVTESELTDKGYATTSDLDGKVDKVSGKQLSTEDFTSALKAKLEGLSNYDATEIEDALSSLQTQFDTLVSGNASDAINSFNEIIAFLEGIQDTQDLSSIIASIEQQIAGKQDVIEGLEDINEKLEVIDNIIGEDGYLYSNGEKVDMRIARSLLPIGTEVPKNANLNTIDFVKVGKYYCHLNVNAETITNCPVSVAFMMDVFNPLSTTLDDETTKEYTYRVRLLTRYDTGQQYIQSCQTNGTAGSWRYNSWNVMPTAPLSNKSPQIGSATQGVYINSSGIVAKMTYTLAKSVPSNAVFTDTNTKVTAVGNHYTPAENTASQIDAPDGEVVVGLKRDAAGHVVGVVSASYSGGGGETGPQGPQGEQGPKGEDGVGITSVVQTTTSSEDGGNNVVTVTLSDGKTSTFTVKNGSKGSQGEKGDKGDTGAEGPQGVQGIQGIQGPKGDTGADGPQGPEGPQGIQGPKGDKGDKGDTGAAGTNGTNGVSVSSVNQTTTSTADGGTNVVTVTLSNGTTSTFNVKNGSKGSNGTNGTNGTNGATFTPSVDSAGNLSWTNNGGLTNPPTVNIKGPKGDKGDAGSGGSGGGSGAYAEVNHGTSDTTFALTPNTFHVWDEVSSLTLTLGSETSGVANEFLFQFTSGSEPTSLTLPDSIKWANNTAPTIVENTIYQISILNGLASVMEFLLKTGPVENRLTLNNNVVTAQYPVASSVYVVCYAGNGEMDGTIQQGETSCDLENADPFASGDAEEIGWVSPEYDDTYIYVF